MRIRAIVLSPVTTILMPAAHSRPAPHAADKPRSFRSAPAACALLLASSLFASALQAQPAPDRNQASIANATPSPEQAHRFSDRPDHAMRNLSAAHPELPGVTADDIATLESNVPALAHSEHAQGDRYEWVSRLVSLEYRMVKGFPDVRYGWYEFVAAKAPALSEAQMDAIAQDWWSAMGNAAVKYDGHELKDASFAEVRAHFQELREGSEREATDAKYWLMRAGTPGGFDRLRIPPQVSGVGPLAVVLARDIEAEAQFYAGTDLQSLRKVVERLIAEKFSAATEESADVAHVVTGSDVDALLTRLSSADAAQRSSARERLREWLRQAVDADLRLVERSRARVLK